MQIFEHIYFYGIAIGFVAFMAIGLCHPLVIKAEYYFGKKIAWLFLFVGVVLTGLSFIPENQLMSIGLGVVGFSLLWSALEVVKQHDRVMRGQAKKNPERNYN